MKKIFLIGVMIFMTICSYGQKVIPLYNGELPTGSEIFKLKETMRKDTSGEIISIRNVSMPTLTAFIPENVKKNATALIICPGGAFQGLAYQQEGLETAKWCTANGIVAFILKYRLMPFPYPKLNNIPHGAVRDSLIIPFVRLAVADGHEAIKYVRNHASEFGVDSTKIGILGYSAGGTLCISVAQTYDIKSRPDFVVPIYAYCGAVIGNKVPNDAPPMFLSWAADDPIANGNPNFYEKWRNAGKSVEMHSFYAGGHGFSVARNNKPSDKWKELFIDWMINQEFIKD